MVYFKIAVANKSIKNCQAVLFFKICKTYNEIYKEA